MTRRKQIRPKRMKYSGNGKEEEEEPDDKQSGEDSEGDEEEEESDKASPDGDSSQKSPEHHVSTPVLTDSDRSKIDALVDMDDSKCELTVRGERLDEVSESSLPSGVERVTPQSPPETPPPKSAKIIDAAPTPISRKEMLLNRNKESSHKSQSHSESSASSGSYSSDVNMLLKLVDNVHARVGSPVKESPIKSLSNLNDRISSITMRSNKPLSRAPVVDPSAMYYQHKHPSPTPKTSASSYLPPKSPSPSARERPLPPYSPYTPPSAPAGDQPLDLSTKPKSNKEKPSSAAKYSFSPKEAASTKDVNSLANLEKKFGGNSFLLDKIGKKPPAPSHRNAFMSAFGVNLYSSAIYSSHPLIPQAQLRPSPTEVPMSKRHAYSSESPVPRKNTYTMAPSAKYSTSTEVLSSRGEVSESKKHTNLQCSCAKEFETLYQLTIHLQDTGHPPFKARSACHQDYPKLVRGQDMWLNQGSEQTRQILRCMQCGESFKSLPELTVHMMQTKHYTNIVGPESHKKMQKISSASLSDSSDNEGGMFKCQLCQESFDDHEGLAIHITALHNKKCAVLIPEHSIKSERMSVSSPSPKRQYSPRPRERNGSIHDGTIDKLKRRLSQSSDDQPARKTPRRDSEDSNGYDVPEPSKIRCENCAEKIDTDKFVEHVRVCVKNSSDPRKEPKGERRSSEREIGRARSRSRSRSSTPQARPSHFESINGDVVVKKEKPEKMETMPDSSEMVHSSTELVTPPPIEDGQSSACALKAMENFIERSFTVHSMKKPHNHHHAGYFDPSRMMRNPFMPRSNLAKNYIQEPLPASKSAATPISAASVRDSQPVSATSVLPTASTSDNLYQNKYLPPTYAAIPSPTRVSPATSPADLSLTASSKPGEEKEGRVASSNHSPSPPPPPSVGSAPRDSPTPDTPVISINIKKEKHDDDDDRHDDEDINDISDKYLEKQEKEPEVKDVGEKKSNGEFKSDSKNDRKGKESPKKAILEKYICESPSSAKSESSAAGGKSPDKAGSSALESLQGLVYGKSFNTEHPLDSLQKLIHSANYSTTQHEMGRHNGMALAATSAAIQQALPGTVILVNPVVTVMPSASGGSPSVSITIPPDSGASPVPKDSKDSPHSPGDKALSDTEGEGNGEYRCQACKRHFASKGSYRYHLSRCHVLSTVKKYQIKESINSSPYVYLPLDHTAKFNKYYEMANELANKGK